MIYKPNTSLYLAILSISNFILSSYPTNDNVKLTFIIIGWLALFIGTTIYFLKQKNG